LNGIGYFYCFRSFLVFLRVGGKLSGGFVADRIFHSPRLSVVFAYPKLATSCWWQHPRGRDPSFACPLPSGDSKGRNFRNSNPRRIPSTEGNPPHGHRTCVHRRSSRIRTHPPPPLTLLPNARYAAVCFPPAVAARLSGPFLRTRAPPSRWLGPSQLPSFLNFGHPIKLILMRSFYQGPTGGAS